MPDFYQSTMDVWNWAKEKPLCAAAGPFSQLFTSCSFDQLAAYHQIPAPVASFTTPAAPRSRAEMVSGYWSPEEALKQTWANIKSGQVTQEAQMRSGNFVPLDPDGSPKEPTDYSPLWFIGGLGVLGLLAVRGLTRS